MSSSSGEEGLTTTSSVVLRTFLAKYMSSEHQDVLINFFIGFVIWNVLNIIVMNLKLKDEHLSRNDWLDLRNRIVSIIHGTSALFLSGYNTYFVHSACGEKNTSFEMFILNFSLTYFTYDLVAMAYLGILDKSMTIHHLIVMFGIIGGLLT